MHWKAFVRTLLRRPRCRGSHGETTKRISGIPVVRAFRPEL